MVTQVIIPSAGLGARFLPISKAIPKEMLPLMNKPALHAIIQEAHASGIRDCIIITNKHKEAIAHYFQPSAPSHQYHKHQLLEELDELIKTIHFTYVEQALPNGLGAAVACASPYIRNELVAVMLPDDLIFGQNPELSNLIAIAHQEKVTVIAVQKVPLALVSSYGVIAPARQLAEGLFEVEQVIEKPSPAQAPSPFAVVGRYLLSRTIFSALNELAPRVSGELQLTDALAHLITHHKERVIACQIQGTRYDLGTPLGWTQAVVHTALDDPQTKVAMMRFLKEVAQTFP
jgi:UTP--glucose-1-phosphate uridylyltransferase